MTTVLEAIQTRDVSVTGGRPAEIAADWDDCGFVTGEECTPWWDAGCWDAGTALILFDAGFDPVNQTLQYKPEREREEMDVMYAFCNSDCDLDDLEWD